MEGRKILNVVLITKKVIDLLLENDVYGVICKFGIEKAYDHVKWAFLLSI